MLQHLPRISKSLIVTLLVSLLPLITSQNAYAEAHIGDVAPQFIAPTVEGTRFSLSEQIGKLVVLEWTNHRCPFVQKHYSQGNMQALQKKYTSEGVVWVSIISSGIGKQGYVTDEEAKALTVDRDAHPSYVIRDETGKIGKMYGAATTPHMFVIDREGKFAYIGAIDSIRSVDATDIAKATNYVDAALTALRKGEPVTPNETPPYGCFVKYSDD